MRAIKKQLRQPLWLLSLGGMLLLSACTPPGPRALLKGEKLVRQGRYSEALEPLLTATRLMPDHPQAWNYLGLAYHGQGEPAKALEAYTRALTLDPRFSPARFNVGCLLLEQNRIEQAVQQLAGYTLLEPNSAQGYARLGTAQLRLGQLDAAEQSFQQARRLDPENVEALNGLGLVHARRHKPLDALAYFNEAIKVRPDYGPALLNAAIVAEQELQDYRLALERYRAYLRLEPRGEAWEVVSALVAALEHRLTSGTSAKDEASARPAANVAAPAPSRESQLVTATNSASPPTIPSHTASQTEMAAQTGDKPKLRTARAPEEPAAQRSAQLATGEERSTDSTASPKLSRDQVAKVEDKQAASGSDAAATSAKPTPLSSTRQRAPGRISSREQAVTSAARAEPPKPNAPRLEGAKAPERPSPEPQVAATASSSGAQGTPTPAAEPPRTIHLTVSFPRYRYLRPAVPRQGNRTEAERPFAEGVKQHRRGELLEAMRYYQQAIEKDPSYFDAYYNLGLAAYETRNWRQALIYLEYALTLRPDSVNARYNFALALKQAGHPIDAAEQLMIILKDHPDHVNAHLSLGNLFAQQLEQPKLAREHYLRVLQLNPRHPRAADIRYWLAANP